MTDLGASHAATGAAHLSAASCGFSQYWSWGTNWLQYHNCGKASTNIKFFYYNSGPAYHCVWAGHTDDIGPTSKIYGWTTAGSC